MSRYFCPKLHSNSLIHLIARQDVGGSDNFKSHCKYVQELYESCDSLVNRMFQTFKMNLKPKHNSKHPHPNSHCGRVYNDHCVDISNVHH